MPAVLELHLRRMEGELQLANSVFKVIEREGVERTVSRLHRRSEERLNPKVSIDSELLPSRWSAPQKAVLLLLLRAYGTKFSRVTLTRTETSLAKNLFDAVRKQAEDKVKTAWLVKLVGAQSRELKQWFIHEGTAKKGHSCSVKLGPKFKDVRLSVFSADKGPEELTRAEMLQAAREFEASSPPDGEGEQPGRPECPAAPVVPTTPDHDALLCQPQYWLKLAVKNTLDVAELDLRTPQDEYLAMVADSLGLHAERDLLLSDHANKVMEFKGPEEERALYLLVLAQRQAERGNELVARSIAIVLGNCSKKVLEDLGIWVEAPCGIFTALIPNLVHGHLAANRKKEALKLRQQLHRFAKKRVLKGPAFKKWELSKEFVAISCKVKLVDDALQHFEWMRENGFEPRSIYDTIPNINRELMNQKRWIKAIQFVTDCEAFFPEIERKTSLWLSSIDDVTTQLPADQASAMVARAFTLARHEPNQCERACLLAKVGKASAGLKMTETYHTAILGCVHLLNQMVSEHRSQKGKTWIKQSKGELGVRLALGDAYLKFGDTASLEREIAQLRTIGRQLIKKGENGRMDEVAWLLARSGKTELAGRLALEGVDFLHDSKVLLVLVGAKMFRRVQELYDQMLTPFYRSVFFCELFQAFKYHGITSYG